MDSSEKMAFFPILIQLLNHLGPFNCLAVLYFPFGLSPNNWVYYVASNLNTKNALKVSFKRNYVKLHNLCNLLVHIHQSQSSDLLLIHSIALILKAFSQCTVT